MPKVVRVRFVRRRHPEELAGVRSAARVADGNRVTVSDNVVDLRTVVGDRLDELTGHRLPAGGVARPAARRVGHEVIADQLAHGLVVGGLEAIEQPPHRLHVRFV